MIRKFFTGLPAGMKLILSIIIIILFFLSAFVVGLLAAMPIFGISPTELQSAMGVNGNINLLKYMQILQGFSLFIIPSFIVAYIFSNNTIKFLYLDVKPKFFYAILAVSLMILALPLINFLAQINSKMNLPEFMSGIEVWMRASETNAEILTKKLLAVNNLGGLMLNIFMIAVLPAIGEELLFRGIIQKYLILIFKNAHVGIILAAIFFSAFHMQFYGFIPRLILGMMLGYLLFWTKSLWVPIIAHFINNAFAVITYYYISKGEISEDVEKIGSEGQSMIFAFISFLLVGAIIYIFIKNKEE